MDQSPSKISKIKKLVGFSKTPENEGTSSGTSEENKEFTDPQLKYDGIHYFINVFYTLMHANDYNFMWKVKLSIY